MQIEPCGSGFVKDVGQQFFVQTFLDIPGDKGSASLEGFQTSRLFQRPYRPERNDVAAAEFSAHLPDGRQFFSGRILPGFHAPQKFVFHLSDQHV